MATGTQVPWTTPGGTPCCCEENCFTDFANEPKPIYAENSYTDIASEDYSALYAGGTYAADVLINIVAARDNTNAVNVFTDTETHTASAVNLPLTQTSNDGPCYLQLTNESLSVAVTRVNRSGTFNSTYTTSVNFVRSLGTATGRKISLASVQGPSSLQTITNLVLLDGVQDSVFSILILLRAGNMTDTVAYSCAGGGAYTPNLPATTATVSLIVGGNTYSAVGAVLHPCFQTSGHYDQVINGATLSSFGFQLSASITGFVSLAVTFTPSAP